jgi:N-acetyl sugar amidotransferase
MRWCKRCVYPEAAVNLSLDEEGVCSSCRTFEAFDKLTPDFWDQRRKRFERILEETLKDRKGNYDVLVPVSGGKDSYYQTHVVCKEYGLKPLLVTYHGNNYLPVADHNRDRMRHVFDADHIVVGPSVDVLRKLNRLCFRKMGDMNWHAHCGIFTVPIQMAVKFDIPLVIWGEIAWDISGMYEPDDFVEFSARVRHEHGLRGFEWYDMLDDPVEKLTARDMNWAKYPTDEEILKVGVRGLYVGNFFKWDPNRHAKLVESEYGWKGAREPFQRTYRMFSNLDDRYENGIHDLLKFVKFGYGRCSDHVGKDIRTGYLTRPQGIELVRKHDHVVSEDLHYWLDYIGMREEEFWRIADGFRDKRVWRRDPSGAWEKDNIWDRPGN